MITGEWPLHLILLISLVRDRDLVHFWDENLALCRLGLCPLGFCHGIKGRARLIFIKCAINETSHTLYLCDNDCIPELTSGISILHC